MPKPDEFGRPAGLILSPGPSSFGEALGAVVIVLADGAMNDLADNPVSEWRPWLGMAVFVMGVHAIWEIARTRRIVAGPTGLHWSGGLSPSTGSAPWCDVRRIESRHDRLGSRWHLLVMSGPEGHRRLLTLRGPGRRADLRVRRPDRLVRMWREAGGCVQETHFPWGWRLEGEPYS